jgi:ribose transport system ATP-binding protein
MKARDIRPSDVQAGAERAQPVVEVRGMSKHFPGVQAVRDIDIDLYGGEVHVIAGENGAGKSTLMKLVAQVEKPDAGEVRIDGERAAFHGPRHAQDLGIAMVHQEFALAPHLSIAENLALGRESSRFGLLLRGSERRTAGELLRRVGLDVDPARKVGSLSVAVRQRVEIAKALAIDARLLIMDEPTATLTDPEIDELFAVVDDLKGHGIAIVFISHRLDEILRVADRVTVMRDGVVVETLPAEQADESTIVRLMVGRDIENLYPKPDVEIGDVLLRVEGLTRAGVLENCSFEVHAGEILGLAGLVGAGRTELARAVFGADPLDSGRIELEGRELHLSSPQDAIAAGIGYLTEDRKREGLAMQLGIDQNITLAALPGAHGLIDLGAERRVARGRADELDIRAPSLRRRVEALSGGNQQKVVVAKWLETHAKVLLFDEPARGVDVANKAEMFRLMGELAAAGRGVVLISSYLPELLNMCDRLLVIRDGKVAGELAREEFSQERIVALATGVQGDEAA